MKHIRWSCVLGSSCHLPLFDERAIRAGVWVLISSVVVLFWSGLAALFIAFVI
jgi:hypothetical protein